MESYLMAFKVMIPLIILTDNLITLRMVDLMC